MLSYIIFWVWGALHFDKEQYKCATSFILAILTTIAGIVAYICFIPSNSIIGQLSLENVPALIHCTGFIVALLQLIVGISKENVLESYLEINQVIAPKMQKIQSYIRWMSLGRVSPERFKPMLEIRKEYLEHALQEIDSQYHSLDQYLIEGCGVDQHCLEKVRYLLRGNSDKN